MSNVENLKAQLVDLWIKRAESLKNGMGDEPYESMSVEIINRIHALDNTFSQQVFYSQNFGNFNPYA